jgi:glutathione S-transferase
MLKIYGVSISAHTRKVIFAAAEKRIPYEISRLIPLAPPPGWLELSPLGLIPVIEDGDVQLADSSVIGLYLHRKFPEPSLYPADIRAYAQALWIEEFVDGGLAPHVLRGLLLQRAFAQRFLNQAPDEQLIKKSLTEMIPPRLAYLENRLQSDYFVGDALSVADISVASILLNFHYAGESVSERTHPRLHRFVRRILRRPSFAPALAVERKAAIELGGLDMTLINEVAG